MKRTIYFFAFTALFLLACNKEPGVGGLASISGKIYVIDLNGAGTDTIDQYYGFDERVYILYGTDDETYDDDFRTSYDGSYRFDNLTLEITQFSPIHVATPVLAELR